MQYRTVKSQRDVFKLLNLIVVVGLRFADEDKYPPGRIRYDHSSIILTWSGLI